MNNYFKIVLIMAAFFVVTITFSNMQVEAGCDRKNCFWECRRKHNKLQGNCNSGKCECIVGKLRPGGRMAEW
uniref:Potassium channel blocker pMeKTx26-1 n=1 Tax=Mesobuthus eupeus TaxID=34648 RepID=A0A088DB12_MESEU|nr:potassium channel blocker pMeKTx26-1 [Mesobuthus eupeus]